MKIVHVVQGSPEWHAARLGVPTASNFDKIISPAKLKPSASADAYLAQLAAEWFLGTSLDDAHTGYMDRGTEMEPEAAAYYAMLRECDPEEVGFCLTDDESAGCSPDRFVGADGGLEIKCPGAKRHMDYLLHGGLREAYWMQVQGALWVTGRAWWDLMSFHPTIPPVIERIEPDAPTQEALAREVPAFAARLRAARERLAKDRPEPAEVLQAVGADDDHGF